MVEWKERFPQWGPGSEVTARIVDGWRSGARKLEAEQMPRVLIAEKPRKSWPDMFMTTNALIVVRDAVKSIVEDYDPQIHQFFPLKLETKRGLDIEGPWFAMNVTEQRETIVIGDSIVNRVEGMPELNSISYSYRDVTVNPAFQPNIHLWRERTFRRSMFASDELIGAVKAAELKIFPYFKAKALKVLK
jgi:hypothetical protein